MTKAELMKKLERFFDDTEVMIQPDYRSPNLFEIEMVDGDTADSNNCVIPLHYVRTDDGRDVVVIQLKEN